MKATDIKSNTDLLNFIEGSLNDLQSGVSTQAEVQNDLLELIDVVLKAQRHKQAAEESILSVISKDDAISSIRFAESFLSGFEDDADQGPSVEKPLANLRQLIEVMEARS